jgi:hypothetical protein
VITSDQTQSFSEWHDEYVELGSTEYEALVEYLDNEHKDEHSPYDDEAISRFRQDYIGKFDSLEDFCCFHFNETHEVPEFVKHYVDYKKLARDYQHNYWISDNGHVFSH